MEIGIIGCGNISKTYFTNAKKFKDIELAACADIDMEAAEAKAAEFNVKAMTVEQLLSDKAIGMIINLTIPQAHTEINIRALNAGKHAYCEKPFALNLADAEKTLELAKRKKLRLGSAPDTFLGSGYQTCRKIIDDGWIGKPIAGTVVMLSRGPEAWHPNPTIFYQKGAGPMLDMGPYYITVLAHLLGPAKSVSAYTQKTFPERLAGVGKLAGQKFKVETPTHYSGSIEFHSGALVNVAISFDVHKHAHTPIEIYGTEGSMICPDPNVFGGAVKIFRPGAQDWTDSLHSHPYKENNRIIGAADIISALKTGRAHRCSGELALHVLEIMLAFEEASMTGKQCALKSKCERPAPMDGSLREGTLD